MAEPVAILVAARDEEGRVGLTVAALRAAFPAADVVVADDGSRDGTAAEAEIAGARVVRLPRRGKGQALTLAERELPPGPILLCDADLSGSLTLLAAAEVDLAVAAFRVPVGGGFGLTKRTARALIRARCGLAVGAPLSGQRLLSSRAREACFPLAPGFGCEALMTAEAAAAGLGYAEVEVDLAHRVTRRDLRGFMHRGRQLRDVLLAFGPLAVNHRGLRLPLVGWILGIHEPFVAAIGLADDLWSGPERGFRAHLRGRRTTGVLKLAAIPLAGLWRTRSLSGALLVGLAANAANQLDTKPGRALKAYLAAAIPLHAPLGLAVLLAPYDLRELAMLGDGGSNTLGALLGLNSVGRLTERGRWAAIVALGGLTVLGERTSLGALIERTPLLRQLDGWGRP